MLLRIDYVCLLGLLVLRRHDDVLDIPRRLRNRVVDWLLWVLLRFLLQGLLLVFLLRGFLHVLLDSFLLQRVFFLGEA